MFRYRVRPRSSAEMQKIFQRGKIPGLRIIQGLFIIIIGIAFIASNANNSSFKEITGHIQKDYAHTTNGLYDATYLQISTDPDDLYIFDKSTFSPAWTDPTVANERVDIYYTDDTPKHIVALQMYDPFGSPTVKYTTGDYISSLRASPISNVGLDVGIILIALGALWAVSAIYKFVRVRRQQRPASPVAGIQASPGQSYRPQPYVSPSASYPDQGDRRNS
ncbi:MAG TPA: hypothetical protein VFQ36_25375 [Ktedonobacteraceae bacterium]|nr:hypothetical protein [Ktedonobacteraceae bacterium]